jgi:hypothetical protein
VEPMNKKFLLLHYGCPSGNNSINKTK